MKKKKIHSLPSLLTNTTPVNHNDKPFHYIIHDENLP